MSAKSHKTYRSEITLDSEISALRKIFQGVEDKRASNASHKVEKSNLESVFGIEKICSDVQLRAVLDNIEPDFLRDLISQEILYSAKNRAFR